MTVAQSQVFRWNSGARMKGDPQIAGEHIVRLREDRLQKQLGEPTAEDVVSSARPAKSPIHDMFEWDDTVAGESYRVEQARHMLRSLVITTTHSEQQAESRAFVAIDIEERRHDVYVPISVAMSTLDMRAQVLERARRELSAFRQKYQDLSELSAVFQAIDSVLSK